MRRDDMCYYEHGWVSTSYADFVVKRLKHKKLIRTYCRDGLRGLRLTAAAKKQLAEAEQKSEFRYGFFICR